MIFPSLYKNVVDLAIVLMGVEISRVCDFIQHSLSNSSSTGAIVRSSSGRETTSTNSIAMEIRFLIVDFILNAVFNEQILLL